MVYCIDPPKVVAGFERCYQGSRTHDNKHLPERHESINPRPTYAAVVMFSRKPISKKQIRLQCVVQVPSLIDR